MTRKRFCKIMMSKGCSRNGALLLAERAIHDFGSYQAYIERQHHMNALLDVANKAFSKFSALFAAYSKAAASIAENFRKLSILMRELNLT